MLAPPRPACSLAGRPGLTAWPKRPRQAGGLPLQPHAEQSTPQHAADPGPCLKLTPLQRIQGPQIVVRLIKKAPERKKQTGATGFVVNALNVPCTIPQRTAHILAAPGSPALVSIAMRRAGAQFCRALRLASVTPAETQSEHAGALGLRVGGLQSMPGCCHPAAATAASAELCTACSLSQLLRCKSPSSPVHDLPAGLVGCAASVEVRGARAWYRALTLPFALSSKLARAYILTCNAALRGQPTPR